MPSRSVHKKVTAVLVLVAGAATSTCTIPVQTHAAARFDAPFGTYRTFAIEHEDCGSDAARIRAPHLRAIVASAIASSLQTKGYRRASAGADFVVNYATSEVEMKCIRRHANADWLDENEAHDFTPGSLVIDIFDGNDLGQVWHGVTQLDPPSIEKNPAIASYLVDDLFIEFPDAQRGALESAPATRGSSSPPAP